MFNFVPLQYYTAIYYAIQFFIVLLVIFYINTHRSMNKSFDRNGAFLLMVFVVLYMGLRPVSGAYFGDMANYAFDFEQYQSGNFTSSYTGDAIFNYYQKVCSSIMNERTWFLLTAFIYVFSIYWACRRMFPQQELISFLVCITAMSFWSYGTNGIRNGIATSLVILAFSFLYRKRKLLLFLFAALLCYLAIGTHKSATLPVLAALLALFYKNTRLYILFWLGCVVLSVLFESFWENFFSKLGFGEDERFAAYLTSSDFADQFSSTGFRWDFLLYSLVPIILGGYVVIIRRRTDKLYSLLLNTYIMSNAFWILIIRASFSNRFAYLSWFLFPIVLIYPVLKFHLWKRQYSKIALILFLHFMFTLILWYIK